MKRIVLAIAITALAASAFVRLAFAAPTYSIDIPSTATSARPCSSGPTS